MELIEVNARRRIEENYSSPATKNELVTNFYRTLHGIAVAPEDSHKELTIVCLDVGEFNESRKIYDYFKTIDNSVRVIGIGNDFDRFNDNNSHNPDAKYIDGLDNVLNFDGADVIITRNPSIMIHSGLWEKVYDRAHEKLTESGKVVSTFHTEAEARFAIEKLKYDFYVKSEPILNNHPTIAWYKVTEGFVEEVKANLSEYRKKFEAIGVNIDEIISDLESEIGETVKFTFDKYIVVATKRSEAEQDSEEDEQEDS